MIFNKKQKAKAVADKLLYIDEGSKTATENHVKRNFFKPYWYVKEAGEYNTKSCGFKWMLFDFWALNHVGFEITFVISAHWGIGFIGMLPYLRWGITIPFPARIQKLFWKLSRKPKNHNVLG